MANMLIPSSESLNANWYFSIFLKHFRLYPGSRLGGRGWIDRVATPVEEAKKVKKSGKYCGYDRIKSKHSEKGTFYLQLLLCDIASISCAIVNNYSPKWRWLAVDIYRAAKRRGKYLTLATDTEVNSCFSIY